MMRYSLICVVAVGLAVASPAIAPSPAQGQQAGYPDHCALAKRRLGVTFYHNANLNQTVNLGWDACNAVINNQECDDPHFWGRGMAAHLRDERIPEAELLRHVDKVGADASDCLRAAKAWTIKRRAWTAPQPEG